MLFFCKLPAKTKSKVGRADLQIKLSFPECINLLIIFSMSENTAKCFIRCPKLIYENKNSKKSQQIG